MPPDLISSNGSSAIANSPESQFKVVRKRNRIPLSCAPCRHRKLKCNRAHPCDNCVKRGDLDSCTYATPSNRKRSVYTSPPTTTPPDEMQNRIDRLESLVLSLMTTGPSATGPASAHAALAQTTSNATIVSSSGDSNFPVDEDTAQDDMEFDDEDADVNDVAKSIGIMKVDGKQSFYVSEAHWFSILAEISEVKTFFQENKKSFEDQYNRIVAKSDPLHKTQGIFVMSVSPASAQEILRSFPPRGTMDVLMARFFDVYNQDSTFQVIHGPTYQKQYDHHWNNPKDSDITWIGLTYSMMMVALVSYDRNDDPPPEFRGRTDEMFRDYRRLTSQCLQLTDFGKSRPYSIETFLFYLMSDLKKSSDAVQNVMLGTTILVRLAMKMGYHRDPKYFPGISPFNGEMRRRLWCMVKQADLRISAQFGLPPMIRSDMCNTEYPANLFDDELDENMTNLPSPRNNTDLTPVSYMLYSAELADVTYEIVEHTQSLSVPTYDKVMEIDRKFRAVHDKILPQLKFRSFEESMNDSSDMIMKRYTLEIMYLKYLMLLHRKFCGCTRYPYSARIGVESALDILRYQKTIHDESLPGRRLADAKVFLTSLTSHDFLLAAMIVSMSLYRNFDDERKGRSPFDLYDIPKRQHMLTSIEESLSIWSSQKDNSAEALKATTVLTALVEVLRNHELSKSTSNSSHPSSMVNTPFSSVGSVSTPDDRKLAEHSAAMTLNMLSAGGISNNASSPSNLFGNASSSSNLQFDAAPSAPSQTTSTNPIFQPNPTSTGIPYLFGSSSIFQTLNADNGSNIPLNWDAFDNYVGTNPVDDFNNAPNIWPINYDPAMEMSTSGQPYRVEIKSTDIPNPSTNISRQNQGPDPNKSWN